MATANPQQAQGSSVTNTRTGSVKDAYRDTDVELLLLNADKEELVVVPKQHAKAFLEEANRMESIATSLSQAREKVLAAEEELAALQARNNASPAKIDAAQKALNAASIAYEKAYKKVQEELADNGYLATSGDGKSILELLPLAKRKSDAKPTEWGRKRTYVRSDKMKNHWRTYKLSAKDSSAGQKKSFIRNGKIDTQTLKDQFTKLEPTFKASWQLGTGGYVFGKLQAWADAFNLKASPNKMVQFGTEVHLFRYFAGANAEGEWNPRAGKVAGKISGKTDLMLAQGKCTAEANVPNHDGWKWAMHGARTGKEFLIGSIRLSVTAKLEAAAGASVAAELALEADYSKLVKPGIKGARRGKKKTGASAASSQKISLNNLGAEASAGADLFAGVKAGGEIKGALQYQAPQEKAFANMASVGPKVDVQWGAGAAASLVIDYRDGKFRCRAKAGLCLGFGAKGEIGFEVDVGQIAHFVKWFFHALFHAGFEVLEIFTRRAYEAVTRLLTLLVHGVKDAYSNINAAWGKFQDQINKEEHRIALMNRILSNPPELRYCTPEAHGILLWEMSRHGKLTKTRYLPENSQNFEFMGRRKQAIMQICQWAQTRRQFEIMVECMNQQGKRSGGSFNANFNALLGFMEQGPLNSSFDDDLRALYDRLPVEPARGYAIAPNNSAVFLARAKMGDSPVYLAALRGQGTTTLDGTALA